MAILDQIRVTSATPQRSASPVARFRRRLAEALELQIELAKADEVGQALTRTRKRWVKGPSGEKELREKPMRLFRWWWKDENGTIFITLRRGTRPLEMAPGKSAIEIGQIEELPNKLALIRDAVWAGELDACATSANFGREVPRRKGNASKPARP